MRPLDLFLRGQCGKDPGLVTSVAGSGVECMVRVWPFFLYSCLGFKLMFPVSDHCCMLVKLGSVSVATWTEKQMKGRLLQSCSPQFPALANTSRTSHFKKKSCYLCCQFLCHLWSPMTTSWLSCFVFFFKSALNFIHLVYCISLGNEWILYKSCKPEQSVWLALEKAVKWRQGRGSRKEELGKEEMIFASLLHGI